MEDKDKLIAELKAENEQRKDLYTDLLEIVEPYLSDFTGYDEKEQAFNIVLAVKELLSEFNTENERLKEENYQLQKDCQICENFIDFIPCKPIRDMDYNLQKVINQRDKYIQTLQEIKKICKETCRKRCTNDCLGTKKHCGYGQILQIITKAEEE